MSLPTLAPCSSLSSAQRRSLVLWRPGQRLNPQPEIRGAMAFSATYAMCDYGCGKVNTSGLEPAAPSRSSAGPHFNTLISAPSWFFAIWRRECRIAILTKSLQDTVRVAHPLPAQPDSAQDSQLNVFTEAR